ncbi:MAG: transcription termination factor NusA [Candidatus Omnitrophica bacterium]|nr:transcription termination factor NusA [Candidatus Omnitrophota bacterium]MBU4478375.1 transcription termination factor NusA [Candidatus Omnitrophota bacterium]MCG2703958.1 transcription termination factor NusA [Candidatus Omnitrophota bacterium]
MSNELLLVLDYIEREKGIDRNVIVGAIESALLSAARKRFGEEADVGVIIDPKSGEVGVLLAGKKVESGEFGRIAAQTAKQIITQKIREAEREVVYNDYCAKVGDITNGIVHRFERNNIIVDLGKSEGVLFYKELIPHEEFKQGSRVRALILDVKKTSKGPQIILSRTNAGFVKRLFELEVPEIYEGIVEIKAISRLAGERTKVAVRSKDDKVDCVGACVGVRGSRIKNIVLELHGEKVDIVRWNEEVREYVKAALSPAKISHIKLHADEKKMDIDVDDDQLSLAIGKKGQNVRLASKLIGWSINIKSHLLEEQQSEKAISGEAAGESGVSLSKISGIGKKTIDALVEAGYNDLESLAKAGVSDLTQVKGIGTKRAEQIIEEVKKIIEDNK